MFPADSGEILIKGKPVSIKSPQEAMANGLAYVPEDRLTEGLFLLQSIRSNVVISNIEKYRTKGRILHHHRMDENTRKWQDALSIRIGSISDPITTLSGGNQQKVVLQSGLKLHLMFLF